MKRPFFLWCLLVLLALPACRAADQLTQSAWESAHTPGDDGPSLGGPAVDTWKGVPILPGAFDEQRQPGYCSFKVHQSVAEMQRYYQEQMKANGWSVTAAGVTDTSPGFLLFTKENQVVSISGAPDTDALDATQVLIIYQVLTDTRQA